MRGGRGAVIVGDMEPVAKRIQYIRQALGMTQGRMGQVLGVSRGAIGNWEYGQGIKTENLTAIAQAFGVPLDWLVTGRGEPPNLDRDGDVQRISLSSITPESSLSDDDGTHPPAIADIDYHGSAPGAVPEINVKAGAGPAVSDTKIVATQSRGIVSGHQVKDEWILPENYLRHELGVKPNRTWVLEVIGDSMAPTLNSGDRVLVDTTQKSLTPDGIFVIDDGEGPMVKRLQRDLEAETARVYVISDNPAHRTFALSLDRFRVVGRVCGKISRL